MTKPKQNKAKHVPMRTCIATGEKRSKLELLRLVLLDDGEIAIDLTGKMKGRGANILPELSALELAFKKRAISRALKLEKPLTKDQQDDLLQKFAVAIEEKSFRPKNKPITIRVKKEDIK